jgi:hypothetical protein
MLFAQEDVGGYLQLSAGTTISVGEFSATDSRNLSSGYAKNGFAAYAIFGHKVQGNFGMFGMFTVIANPINKEEYAHDLNTNIADFSWSIVNRPRWTVVGFTFGPHLSLPLGRFAFDARLMAGGLNFRSPLIEAMGVSRNGTLPNNYLATAATEATALAYGGGLSIKFEVKRGWVWIINGDYLAGRPRFKDVETNHQVPYHNYSNVTTENYRQKFSMTLVTTGLGLVF